MKKSKFLILTTLSPIISLPFLSASCITEAKADNKTEKDIKINENKDEKNSSETMNDKQKQDKSNIDSKMEEKEDKDSSKSEEGKSMKNKHADEKHSSETMNDKQKQDSKPNSESNSANQDSETNSESNSENQGSNPDSEPNSKNQDSETNLESNSGNQGSKTNGSSNESTSPSENTQNDMTTKNSEINDYLNKVEEYGKETSEFANLLVALGVKEDNELLKKYAKFGPLVKELFDLYGKLKSDFEKTKKEIEKVIRDPESKNDLLDILKQYEESREKIKAAIEELKGLNKNK